MSEPLPPLTDKDWEDCAQKCARCGAMEWMFQVKPEGLVCLSCCNEGVVEEDTER